jgi:hypothetical protein
VRSARPTLRCLRDDLHLPLPPVSQPLDEVDHPLVRKAGERFADAATPHERIAAVDDQVLFKVKAQRWRGAVWVEPDQPWLVAAGRREDGSPDDFYAALAADAQAARARHNATHPSPLATRASTAHLLPGTADRDRYQAEAGIRLVGRLRSTVHDLVRASLRDGREHRARLDTFTLGIQVRADDGHDTYAAIRISGSVPDNITFTILDLVPGCAFADWMPEFHLPDRGLDPGEQAFSNIMNPIEAAKLLDLDTS